MEQKRVVIVDDSGVMRALVRKQLLEDGRFAVVGEAGDPYEARDIIKRTNPDVITLDVEMPRMDGLSFLEKLMRLRPLPVVMFSTETHKGSAAAVEALSLGAIDCIGKPSGASPETFRTLAERVYVASCARLPGRATLDAAPPGNFVWNGKIVLIGASTGGVDALEKLLAGYPANCPPTLIAQHMPESFLESFADRLSRRVQPDVSLARDGERLDQGMVRIAPGGSCHLKLGKFLSGGVSHLLAGEKVSGHRPSVDVLFRSAVSMSKQIVGVLLTGMGRDGAQGLAELRQGGAFTIAQDEESCVVYGMPRVAVELGGACVTQNLSKISGSILRETGKGHAVRAPLGVARA